MSNKNETTATFMNLGRRLNLVSCAALLIATSVVAPALNAQPQRMLYYNRDSGLTAVTMLDDNGVPNTLGTFDLSTGWTTIVDTNAGVLFYNSDTGSAAVATIGADGSFSNYALGFSPGWSQIVYHKGYLMFYNRTSGLTAFGDLRGGAFHQYLPNASLSAGWTHILSTDNGLLFYNADTGSGATGDLRFSYSGCTGFYNPTGVGFQQKRGFAPGSFTTGWTQLVKTIGGVLFYRPSDGLQVMLDVSPDGNVTTRGNTLKYLDVGWTSIAVTDKAVQFYNVNSGDGAVGQIVEFGLYTPSYLVGTLAIDQTFPGAFSTGWTTVSPFIPYVNSPIR